MTEVRQNILSGYYTFQPSDIWDNVSDSAKDFIKSILVTDPNKRPNVSYDIFSSILNTCKSKIYFKGMGSTTARMDQTV